MVGGGVHGKVVGTAHSIMIGVGLIIMRSRVFILTWTRVGEDTTESIVGTDTGGTMNRFLTSDLTRTGRAGRITDIGKSKRPGESRAINPDRNNRDRN